MICESQAEEERGQVEASEAISVLVQAVGNKRIEGRQNQENLEGVDLRANALEPPAGRGCRRECGRKGDDRPEPLRERRRDPLQDYGDDFEEQESGDGAEEGGGDGDSKRDRSQR